MIVKDGHAVPIYRYTTKEAALKVAAELAATGGKVYVLEAVALAKPKVETIVLTDTTDKPIQPDPPATPQKKESVKPISKPKKTSAKRGGRQTIDITVSDVKDSGALECDTIPEVIEAILVLCNCNKASIARLLEVDNAAISSAANDKVYPYVANAFRAKLGFPKPQDGEYVPDARERYNSIHQGLE
jgi:hypothetical protein